MKVLIVTNMAPFVWGGAEELANHLQRNLISAGQQAEILRIPFKWDPASEILSQMLMVRAFELTNVDHVIALKFPAYCIRHPSKTLWLLHQYRQAYDMLEAGNTNIQTDEEGNEIRQLIISADNQTFKESRKIFTNSHITSNRLKKYNGFDSEVLLPPVNDPEIFASRSDEQYIFAGGRINRMKRQHLLVESLKHADKNVKLIIGGPPDTKDDERQLRELIDSSNMSDRVKLDLRLLPRSQYADYVNRCRAVAYIPLDEDSYGYVAMEAAMAAKPVLTLTDSGGVSDFVIPNQSGWICHPDPKEIGRTLSTIANGGNTARDYGHAAKSRWDALDINWQTTVERLIK